MQKATTATAAKLVTSLVAIVLAGCGAGASASIFSHKDRFAPAASASNTFVYSWVQRRMLRHLASPERAVSV